VNQFEAASNVIAVLRREGYEALMAGGCVRDMIMGREPADYDVATSARPERVLELFRRTVPVGVQFGVVLVMDYGPKIEVATFRRDEGYEDGRRPVAVTFTDAREDALRRDFTINAMFFDPQSSQVIDYVGGREDIGRRIVRAVGDPEKRFEEDKLRLLRAARFAATLDFQIDPESAQAIRRRADHIGLVSQERIAVELERMLVNPRRAVALRMMDELGLLQHILPEVAAMKGVRQSAVYHPEGDVFEHTLLSIEKLEKPSWPLALATLLHDIGKPVVKDVVPGKFYNHDAVGSEMAEAICRRLKLSNEVTERVAWMVRRHLYIWNARSMRLSTLKRLFAHPGYEELLQLHRADALGSMAEMDDLDYAEGVRKQLPPETIKPQPLLGGQDLIEMGLKPGPVFGKLLAELTEEQLQGNLSTREDALAFVRRRLDEMGFSKN